MRNHHIPGKHEARRPPFSKHVHQEVGRIAAGAVAWKRKQMLLAGFASVLLRRRGIGRTCLPIRPGTDTHHSARKRAVHGRQTHQRFMKNTNACPCPAVVVINELLRRARRAAQNPRAYQKATGQDFTTHQIKMFCELSGSVSTKNRPSWTPANVLPAHRIVLRRSAPHAKTTPT